MSILETKGLTMRFGGLTAVSQFDFKVEPGKIFSIIGPNGAGKTTVFNAVTGLYEPTEGAIVVEGKDPRRPFRGRVIAAISLIALFTGMGLSILSTNIDLLWRTVVALNYPDTSEPFPRSKAWSDFKVFLNGGVMTEREPNPLTEIEVKPRGGKFVVRSRGNKTVLETHDDEETATRRLEVVEAMVNLAGSARTAVRGDGKWVVVTPGREYLGVFDREADALQQARDLHDLSMAEVVEEGGKFHVKIGARSVATFNYPFEAEEYKQQMVWAADGTVEKTDGKWIVLAPNGKTVLDVFESREKAKARLLEVAIAAGKLKWRLTTRASSQSLGIVFTPEKAAEEVVHVEELMSLGSSALIEEREGKTVALSADRSRVLATFESRADAEERLRFLASVRRAILRERVFLWLSLFGGMILGAGGAYVVWRRTRRTPDVIALGGIARTFQNIRLFQNMTVVENVLMGMDRSFRAGVFGAMFRTPGFRREEKTGLARAMELLDFVGLAGKAQMLAKNLPYGGQRRLEIARAMATQPRLLLLDEPAAGMNPAETSDLIELVRKIRDTGITVLLIEHHMNVVMGISDRIAVLDYGVKIAEGTPAEVKANPKVIEAYLGKEEIS